MKKAYIFMADGCETIEALTPVDIFYRAGIDAVTVSVMGQREIQTAQGIRFLADELFENLDFKDGDLFVLPGGMPGTANLAAFDPLLKLLKDKNESGIPIGAICAAPALILGENGFLRDRRATCFPGMEEHLKGAKVQSDEVVTDGNITTSRGMGTALAFALELTAVLLGKETSEKIGNQVVYRR